MFELIFRADKVVHVIVALITVSRSVPQHTERAIFELRPGIRMHPSRETLPEQHVSMMLKVYLQKAYEEVGLASDAEGTTIQDLTAELKSNAENLILVYSGAFNPPHQGHVEVIRSGLRLDLAAVAIVILPSDDQYAKDKVAGKRPYFFLNQRRRADIWQASASFPKTRVWVWRNTKPLFYSFAESLLRLAKTDRYKLEFGRLDGPDNLNMQNPFAYVYREGFRRMVVTNKARHLQSHFGPDNKPLRWNGCGDWSIWQGSPDDDSLLLEKEDHRAVAILWTCTSVNDPSKKGVYLQYIRPVPNDINSTDLRQAFLQSHNYDEDSLNALSTGALIKLLGM